MTTFGRFSFVFLVLFHHGQLAHGEQAKPVLNDWFALGSGCRAKHDLAGNVTAIPKQGLRKAANEHAMVYSFKDFELNETHGKVGQSKFARECSIRLNINPPAGMIIKTIKASTSFEVTKKSAVGLNLYSELKLGSTSLGSFRKEYKPQDLTQLEKIDVSLSNNDLPSIVEPKLNCGDPKIIALDISWMGEKSDKPAKSNESFKVKLGQNSEVLIETTLEPCQPK